MADLSLNDNSICKNRGWRFIGSGLCRLAAITAVVFILLVGLAAVSWPSNSTFVLPAVFIAAPLLAEKCRISDFPKILPSNCAAAVSDFKLVIKTALLALLPAFLFIRMYSYIGLALPLKPPQIAANELTGWLIYQLLYVAVPEEIFFRGFIQKNTAAFLVSRTHKPQLAALSAIVISSAVFAIAHIVITANPAAGITFLPAIMFGWLYFKTGTLAVPILMHFAANVFYMLVL